MQRIQMNTKSLQKHYSDVYRDFFAKNDLVVSGCFSFPWGNEGILDNSNYLRIKSKIPLKCYVGINIRKDNKINFSKVSFFDIVEKKFNKIEYNKINKEEEKIIELLKNRFKNIGFDIEILSETTRGHSFGFSGTSGAVISSGLHILLNSNLDLDILKNEYIDNNFKDIFHLAGQIDYISRYGNSKGHNSIFTLSKNKGVSYFYSCNDSLISDIGNIENQKYIFEQVQKDDKNIELPFDYYIIFSGLSTNTKQVEYYKEIDLIDNVEFNNFIKNKLLIHNDSDYLKNILSENFIKNNFYDLVNIKNIKTLEYFYKFFNTSFNNNLIEDFIEHINNYRNIIGLIEKQNNFAQDFIYYFRKNSINSDEKIGIIPAYSGKLGGGYIVITKSGISRNTVEKTIDNIKNMYSNVEIEYSSYLDGESYSGVNIEQYISAGIYSEYVDKNKLVYKNNKGKNYIGDYSEIIEKEQNGLLFDMINNKIYLNGEKLTSKDIPSQNTTIEIVTKLLENIGEEISNKDLPASSYSKNKNEMLGKIILPLLKIVEEKTKEKLQIVCKGSITEFFIKMNDVNLKIGTIDRI